MEEGSSLSMKEAVEKLTDRERQTLSLLARGHEAKSIAAALNLSVHTVNERLRAARRKLGVSSSREAARLLLADEAPAGGNENLGYEKIGVAQGEPGEPYPIRAPQGATGVGRRAIWVAIGAIMLVVLVSVLVATQASNGPAAASPRAAEPINPLPSLFAVSDYPAAALTQHVQGITDFRLQIGESGRVTKCDIERSSGSAALDEATCQVIIRRSRFRPATNAAGRPVDSIYTGMIHWML